MVYRRIYSSSEFPYLSRPRTLDNKPHLTMRVGTSALAVVALWWACETALRPVSRRRFGQELTDGYPRWRVALGCLTQIVWFPVMFLAFVFGRQAWLMESFLLVFGYSLLQDCVRFPRTMGPMLLLHHAACLVGLLVARFAAGPEWRSVFPYFHCGCTALELGSGACNVYWPSICVHTYVPGPPYCTCGLRAPASRLPYVPEAQGSLPRGDLLYVRRTRTRLGRAVRVRTAYRGTPGLP